MLEIILLLSILCFLLYAIFVLWMLIQWVKTPEFEPNKIHFDNKISILIPFRNEYQNIRSCIQALLDQDIDHSFIEIIAIDDGSDDNSELIVLELQAKYPNLTLLQSNGSGKKRALKTGIDYARNNWIATIDADTIINREWAMTLLSFIQTSRSLFVVMPVEFQENSGFLHKLQEIEFLSLTGSGACSLLGRKCLMANGANLAFKKDFFYELKGYEDNINLASGDDLFLFFKAFDKEPLRVNYLKSNKVIARAQSSQSVNEFIEQRLRWASKTSAYSSNFPKFIAWLVLSVNLLLFLLVILVLFKLILLKFLLAILIVKFILDIIFISPIAKFHSKKYLIIYSIPLSILYPFYIVMIGLISFLYKPKWKGRSIINNEAA